MLEMSVQQAITWMMLTFRRQTQVRNLGDISIKWNLYKVATIVNKQKRWSLWTKPRGIAKRQESVSRKQRVNVPEVEVL